MLELLIAWIIVGYIGAGVHTYMQLSPSTSWRIKVMDSMAVVLVLLAMLLAWPIFAIVCFLFANDRTRSVSKF